jgi:hypothetical protein
MAKRYSPGCEAGYVVRQARQKWSGEIIALVEILLFFLFSCLFHLVMPRRSIASVFFYTCWLSIMWVQVALNLDLAGVESFVKERLGKEVGV